MTRKMAQKLAKVTLFYLLIVGDGHGYVTAVFMDGFLVV